MTDLEEEMRRALFGSAEVSAPTIPTAAKETIPDVIIAPAVSSVAKKRVARPFTPRLRVTLLVGNEFEGETQKMTHEVDTLSILLAEQEAVKAARKKFRYVEVLSVKSM